MNKGCIKGVFLSRGLFGIRLENPIFKRGSPVRTRTDIIGLIVALRGAGMLANGFTALMFIVNRISNLKPQTELWMLCMSIVLWLSEQVHPVLSW